MAFVASLLDKYKTARRLSSDSAIGDELGVTRQTISQWRSGTAYPDEDKIVSLAIGANEEPAGWLNAVRAERCTGPAALAYRKVARSFGIAAMLCLAVYTAMATEIVRADSDLTIRGRTMHCARYRQAELQLAASGTHPD